MRLCRLLNHQQTGAHRKRRLWLALCLWIPASVAANPTQDLATLRSAVADYLMAFYQVPGIERTRVAVEPLDRRLRLAPCEQPLEFRLSDEERRGGNLTVHTRCPGPTAWALYVPAQIAVYRQVAVAAKALGRGHRITAADVALEVRNTGQLRQGFVAQAETVTGKELRRPLSAGEPMRLSILQEPTVIERGDQVRLRANVGTIMVDTTGTALGSGRVGDQIRVRNDRSERVVRGRITAPGTVEVQL
ncbi:flagellar basal body P-ring formation chaperone FlgA [Marinimicrobium sp. ARAG 43.8]|uniref:flagellar basal body P-ring formation chaperone FlgA n=1 Tax=Marinimicrobium sp. ARAG 43.8 TaxID=3418719 RepID=UPI003CEDD98F